jgi:competence protein ComEA
VFEKLSRKIGFTVTEVKVLLFLLLVFIAGLSYKAYKINQGKIDYRNFDYSTEEKLFEQINDDQTTLLSDSTNDINIDSKKEVLDFNTRKFNKKKAIRLPGKKSINLNKAGVEDLVILPGIGEKTAQKIIDLRDIKGGFKKLNELLEVKGIGKTKFNIIEKFLYIE